MRVPSLALLALCCAAPAQQTDRHPVDPVPFEWARTVRETGFPFGHPTRRILRYQQVHDGMVGRGRTITAVAFRRAPESQGLVPPFTADVSLVLSSAPTTAATISAEFAANTGADATVVLPRRRIAFPESRGPWVETAPFEYVLPCTVPFAYAGTRPLCLELTVHDHTNRVPAHFALHAEGNAHVGTMGTSCGPTLHTTLAPDQASHAVEGLRPGSPAFLLFGLDFDTLLGQPLPLDLGPFGAQGCSLHLAPFVDVQGVADATGRFAIDVPLTPVPGAWYGVQGAGFELVQGDAGLFLSAGNVVVPRTGRTVGRLWAEDVTAPTGNRQPVFGLVIQVR